MQIPEIIITGKAHISIDQFRELDHLSIDKYKLPIELMMENAGLQLARLVTFIYPLPCKILIGVGPGNNGGGGLVTGRRLAGWGYKVHLQVPVLPFQSLSLSQYERALAFGAITDPLIDKPDVFVDAWLGFSQRLPLSDAFIDAVEMANHLSCPKISLDLPTGFDKISGSSLFKPNIILTLAAMKTELLPLVGGIDIYLADLGLPREVYSKFGLEQPDGFKMSGLLRCVK
jgi:NAD(P)H-hydrate epimerase